MNFPGKPRVLEWLAEFTSRVMATQPFKERITKSLAERNLGTAWVDGRQFLDDLPYGNACRSEAKRKQIVFITGRYRSGSTLLWNLFRSLPGVTAFYEPFNERRWFDPRTRGAGTDPTHLEVSNYWSEYEGLEHLSECFDPRWKFRRLYMPAEAWDERMIRYIESLIDAAADVAVLQFNEVDFRLPWLRAKFPQARLLHLYRNPRDQWVSTLGGRQLKLSGAKLRDFEPYDGFYLLPYAQDLREQFHFLSVRPDDNPYELFYELWLLSYIFGRRYSHYSVGLDQLIAKPADVLQDISTAIEIPNLAAEMPLSIIKTPPSGKWPDLGTAAEFSEIERRACDRLRRYLAATD